MLRPPYILFFFFFNDTATTEIYTLSLHDALPIFGFSPRAPWCRKRTFDSRPPTRLTRCWFGVSHCRPFARRFSWFADTPHHGLDQAVDTFFFVSVHDAESEFGLVLGPLADANGQLSAEIVFDERGLVAALLRIPGVHPQRAEVACRALRTARRGQEVLWFVSGGIRDAIQLKPGHGADVCRRRAFSHGRSEEHTSELQSRLHLVCRLLLENKKNNVHHTV